MGPGGVAGSELKGEDGSGGVVVPGVRGKVGEVGWECVAGGAGGRVGGGGWGLHGCGWMF